MAQANPNSFSSPWQGSLWDLTRIVMTIRRSRAFGRLTLRNSDRVGIVHLYFHGGNLVHIVGSSGDAEATLRDLSHWTHAAVRFERGATSTSTTVTPRQVQSFDELLLHLQQLGLTATPPTPRVVEGGVVSTTPGEQLLTPQEWRLLIEGTRRVSLAVAHLIGPREALKVLRDILDDCSAAFPAFITLQIANTGYLQITDTSQLDRMPREELLEGFSALISTCQYFCAPIIGEVEAHKLIIQSLGNICTAMITLGVFQVNNDLLASPRKSSSS
ncbi:MAG TPA: DUF4388 domain-containing protein [Ktedonobacteraceae bacterium]|nr:DUF4388 domain-containing protein [Ktedonobacteraceae bacterium]